MTTTLSLVLAILLHWPPAGAVVPVARQDYGMITYYLVLLKRAPTPPAMAPEAATKLQAAHIAHLEELGEQGFGMAAGPFGDDGEIRGIVILKGIVG
jgi:uncharacterized protein